MLKEFGARSMMNGKVGLEKIINVSYCLRWPGHSHSAAKGGIAEASTILFTILLYYTHILQTHTIC